MWPLKHAQSALPPRLSVVKLHASLMSRWGLQRIHFALTSYAFITRRAQAPQSRIKHTARVRRTKVCHWQKRCKNRTHAPVTGVVKGAPEVSTRTRETPFPFLDTVTIRTDSPRSGERLGSCEARRSWLGAELFPDYCSGFSRHIQAPLKVPVGYAMLQCATCKISTQSRRRLRR